MTDLQSKAKTWLQSLIKEVRARDLREELLPDNGMSVDETVNSLDTVGMEAINLAEESTLEEMLEDMPTPEKMAEEDLGQALFSAWTILSPTD